MEFELIGKLTNRQFDIPKMVRELNDLKIDLVSKWEAEINTTKCYESNSIY